MTRVPRKGGADDGDDELDDGFCRNVDDDVWILGLCALRRRPSVTTASRGKRPRTAVASRPAAT